jgi:hypothetical protein
LQEKHGAKSRRNWRKLHLAVDADSGRIVAHTLTDQDTDDPSQVAPLLDQIDGGIGQSPQMGPMMARRHIGLSCAIAMPRRLSSHHAQRRYKAAIRDHPASGTATSL